jgi:hypothetical protein
MIYAPHPILKNGDKLLRNCGKGLHRQKGKGKFKKV